MQKEDFQREVFVYRNKMYRFALSFLKDEDESKDVVQEVMMKLWESRNDLSEIKNIEAWCMTLTRNKSLDMLKRVGKKRSESLEISHEPNHSTSDTPLKVYAAKEAIARVKKLTEELPEKQKTAFTLREIEGYSYLEICDIMDINMSQCKVNLFRARTALKEKLQADYNYE
jgi:RNA polymerase sigma-70 factor (ECF subfamily)